MKEWIFDASITMAWCFDDERTPQTDSMLDRLAAQVPAIVPQVWPLEVVNVLVLAVKKRRISSARRQQFLSMLSQAPISVDFVPLQETFHQITRVAEKFSLTSYDASYLELAMRLGLPLATLDRDLHAAAHAAGVQLL